MIDAVLSYHMNPATCGVAKFNHRLARELGVRVERIRELRWNYTPTYKHPLISVKPSEIPTVYAYFPLPTVCRYDLFLHEWTDTAFGLCRMSETIYAANTEIAQFVRTKAERPDVIEAWCPSTIEGNAHRGTINVLTFGMAHKIQTARYEKLKALLDATGEDYTVSVSTAIHEGSPWDETALVGEKLRAIFGDHLRVLGYLADDALVAEMARSTAVALFFDPALRANNTTAHAVLDASRCLITNLDEQSPGFGVTVDAMTPSLLKKLAQCPDFHTVSPDRLGWSELVDKMQAQPCAK